MTLNIRSRAGYVHHWECDLETGALQCGETTDCLCPDWWKASQYLEKLGEPPSPAEKFKDEIALALQEIGRKIAIDYWK